MPQSNDLSRCLIPFRQDETLVAVVEMSKTSWLVAGMIPGVARHPLKKLVPDEKALFELLERWRDEAVKAGKIITRITVAYEAGRDGFVAVNVTVDRQHGRRGQCVVDRPWIAGEEGNSLVQGDRVYAAERRFGIVSDDDRFVDLQTKGIGGEDAGVSGPLEDHRGG